MSDTREPLGYLPCKSCLKIKAVYQKSGKHSRYLFTNGCDCKVDGRSGEPAQVKFRKHMSKEDAQAELEKLQAHKSKPVEPPKPTKEKSSKAPWVIAGVLGVFGLLSLRG